MTLNKKLLGIINSKKFIYCFSFLIPAILMLIIYVVTKIYPFGNNSVLIWDCNGQYIDYFSYFKSIFLENNDFFYTFSKSLGGDMVGLSAYYLLSPLNFLFLAFKNTAMPLALSIIVILKIGLCGLSFNYFLNKTYTGLWKSLIFSTAYAFSGYNVAYFWDVMWLDGVILLPLVVLGINNIFKKNNGLLYCVALTATILTNYYIGFMVCIASVFYFVYKLFLSIDGLSKIKLFYKRILKYIISSLASVFLSAFWLIPTVLSLMGGKLGFSFPLNIKNYGFFDLFTKFFSGTVNIKQLDNGLPNVFCGMFAVLLLMLYFFNGKISLKEKFLSGSLLFVFIISFYIEIFNMVWHGFNFPSCFPYRYSFIFCFFVICFSYKGFINLNKFNFKKLIFVVLAFLALTVFVFRKNYDFITFKYIYFNVTIFVITALLLFLAIKFSEFKNVFLILIFLLDMFNASLNMCVTIKRLSEYSSTTSDYVEYTSNVLPAVNAVKQSDDGFYRMEKTFSRTPNDAMAFNYNGVTHFSSCEKAFVKDFVGKMGYHRGPNFCYYDRGATVSADSLLGIKYLLTKEKLDEYRFNNYQKIFKVNDIHVYKNKTALPIAFCATDKIFTADSLTNDIFKFQNDIWRSTSPDYNENIFNPVLCIDKIYVNLKSEPSENYTKYQKLDDSKEAYIEYKLKINTKDDIFAYYNVGWLNESEIFVNDISLGDYTCLSGPCAKKLGKFELNDIITVKIKLKNTSLLATDFFVYSENLKALENYYDNISSQKCRLQKISSSNLLGNVEILKDNQYLLFSIPYENAWKISVDGTTAEKFKVFDSLMCIPIKKGTHRISLKYIPDGFVVGFSISVVTLIILLVYLIITKKIKKKMIF